MDNNRGTIWECVSRGNGSWTRRSYVPVSVSAERPGTPRGARLLVSRNWDARPTMADWIAEESAQLGIPIVLLSDLNAGGSAGVTFTAVSEAPAADNPIHARGFLHPRGPGMGRYGRQRFNRARRE